MRQGSANTTANCNSFLDREVIRQTVEGWLVLIPAQCDFDLSRAGSWWNAVISGYYGELQK